MRDKRILVTGGGGYIGGKLLHRLQAGPRPFQVVATDVRLPAEGVEGVEYVECDVRSAHMGEVIDRVRPHVVVHLAAIVTPPPGSTREFEYSVDVDGTRNVLSACISAAVGRLIVTSSGAAYGFHADHPEWIREDSPVRGNQAFAYAWHKRLVEEMLAQAREECRSLEQIVFRVSTVLGAGTRSPLSAMFDRPTLLGVRGGDDRWVLVWDEDVARCLYRAVSSPVCGVFNLAADGAISMGEMARMMGKPYIRLPSAVLNTALRVLRPLRLTGYGPEHVRFLQYRPVLDNTALKQQFGYSPRKSSREVFEYFMTHRRAPADFV